MGNEELGTGLKSSTWKKEDKAKTIRVTVRKPLGSSASVGSVMLEEVTVRG